MTKELDKGLVEVIEALRESFDEEARKKYGQWVNEVIVEHSHLDFNNPEECYLMLSLTLGEQAETFVKIVLSSIELDSLKKHKLEFVYLHFGFIERHLENVLTKHEGLFASSDKSRWLINGYVNYLMTNNLPVMEERQYWHPKKAEIKEWIDWIDSMYDLYYGKPEPYMLNMLVILKHYQKEGEKGQE